VYAGLLSAYAAEEGYNLTDNDILALALHASYGGGGYTVVSPETTLDHMDLNSPERMESAKKYILEHIKTTGYDLGPLIDLLLSKNMKPVRLTLPSAPQAGYLIDYDGRFKNYFAQGGGGWEKWYAENPMAHVWTKVSLPAFDPEQKIVLVYMGTQSHWLAGAGYVIAYRYEDGVLHTIGEVMMWIS